MLQRASLSYNLSSYLYFFCFGLLCFGLSLFMILHFPQFSCNCLFSPLSSSNFSSNCSVQWFDEFFVVSVVTVLLRYVVHFYLKHKKVLIHKLLSRPLHHILDTGVYKTCCSRINASLCMSISTDFHNI